MMNEAMVAIDQAYKNDYPGNTYSQSWKFLPHSRYSKELRVSFGMPIFNSTIPNLLITPPDSQIGTRKLRPTAG